MKNTLAEVSLDSAHSASLGINPSLTLRIYNSPRLDTPSQMSVKVAIHVQSTVNARLASNCEDMTRAKNIKTASQQQQKKHGRCRLCQLKKTLRNSHLLPASLYKQFRDPSRDNPNSVVVKAGRAYQTSRQIQDYLLCDKCEDLFSKHGEAWVTGNCYRENGSFYLRDSLLELLRSCNKMERHSLL